jgi:trehalose synthase
VHEIRGVAVFEVKLALRSVEPFAQLVAPERLRALEATAADIRGLLGARVIWNINSTASGGGVAEMLRSLLRYGRGLGMPIRWLVIEGPPEFFRITKRVHNALHDAPGDGSPLGREEAALYERVLHENAVALDAYVREGDVVVCHDPQTAGLIPHVVARGAKVVWRCHIGHEKPGGELERGWGFLRKYVEHVPLAVFSRAAYAPRWIPHAQTAVTPPTIDPFSAKNVPMDGATVRAILGEVGIVECPRGEEPPKFIRDDGSISRIDHQAEVTRLGRPPSCSTPLVVQVSRWDHMKDPLGVMEGFARYVASAMPGHSELVVAGPQMKSVADDPEGPQVFREVETAWRGLPEALRRTIHLVQLPMDDAEENAAMVNALQRHAAVVVQKSLREGFGLTVTEAMWKGRPVVASAVGGIQDQITDGVDGLLLQDPCDLGAFGALVERPLRDPASAEQLGHAAYERVRRCSLSIASLEAWGGLLGGLLVPRAAVG